MEINNEIKNQFTNILNSEKTSSYSDYREIISLHSRVYDRIIRDYAHILRY